MHLPCSTAPPSSGGLIAAVPSRGPTACFGYVASRAPALLLSCFVDFVILQLICGGPVFPCSLLSHALLDYCSLQLSWLAGAILGRILRRLYELVLPFPFLPAVGSCVRPSRPRTIGPSTSCGLVRRAKVFLTSALWCISGCVVSQTLVFL